MPARVNGEGPYRFLLDTGALSCIVSLPLARALGLPRGKATLARGPVDAIEGYSSAVARLSAGSAAREDMQVAVMDCSDVSAYVHDRVDGYQGMSFLAHFAITLSYRDGILLTLAQ